MLAHAIGEHRRPPVGARFKCLTAGRTPFYAISRTRNAMRLKRRKEEKESIRILIRKMEKGRRDG